MAFSPETIELVRLANPLSDVVAERVELRRRGGSLTAICMFHQERTPSFHVFEDDRGGHFHCFGCGVHGDVLDFTQRHLGLGFSESIRFLADRAGIEVSDDPLVADRRRLQSQVAGVMDYALRMAQATLPSLVSREPGHPALASLARLGLDPVRAERAGLGFVPDGGLLTARLLEEGVPRELLDEAGLTSPSSTVPVDSLGGRIVHPIRDRLGRVVALIGQPVDVASGDAVLVHHRDAGRLPAIVHYGRQLGPGRPDPFASPPADGRLRGQLDASSAGIVVPDFLAASILAGHGFTDVMAPTSGLLLPEAIAAAWRVADEPVLIVPDDEQGAAFMRSAIEGILPLVGPGRSFRLLKVQPAAFPGGPAFDPEVMRLRVLAMAENLVDAVWDLEVPDEAPPSPGGKQRTSWDGIRDRSLATGALDRIIRRVRAIHHEEVRDCYALEYANRARDQLGIDPKWPEADPARVLGFDLAPA